MRPQAFLDAVLADWLHNADDAVLECRAQGHEFDHIHRRRRGALKNTRVGSSQITWSCPNCEAERTRTIEPDGTLFPPVYYAYRYPKNYKGPAGITRRMCFDELQRRIEEDTVQAEIKAATAKASARAGT